jgi:hypothetical protein
MGEKRVCNKPVSEIKRNQRKSEKETGSWRLLMYDLYGLDLIACV